MWLVRLPCSKAEADALDVAAEGFGEGDDSPTLTAVLMEEPRPERWYLEAFCPQKPDADLIARLRKLTRSRAEAVIEKLPDQDWVSLSQQGAGPIRIGRFFIHSQHHEQASPAGSYPIQIEAAQAFGTGSHATTQGCLALLERLAKASRPPVAAFLRRMEPGFPMWDEIAVAVWLDPTIVKKSERLWYDFNTDFGAGYGDMLTWHDAYRPHLDEGQADVVLAVDVTRMEALMAKALGER